MPKVKSPTPQELYRARKQQEEQEKLAYLPPGFINHGNTCFMNSVLQGLIATRLLSNLVHFEPIPERVQRNSTTLIASQRSPQLTNGHELGGIYEQKWDAGMPIGDVFVGVMYRGWEVQRHRRRENLSPKALLAALGQKYDQYLDFAQQDAHEFLRILLDAMRMEEFDVIKKRQPSPPKSTQKSLRRRTTLTPANIDSLKDSEAPNARNTEELQLMSLSDMLFGGKLTSVLVCQKCKHISQTYEDFNDLSLSLKAEDYAKERKRDRFKKLARKMGMPVGKHKSDSRKNSLGPATSSMSGLAPEETVRPLSLSDEPEKQLEEPGVPVRPSSVPPSPAPSGLDGHEPPLSIDVSRRRSLDGIRVSNDSTYKESDDEDGVMVILEREDAHTEISPLSSTSPRDKPLPPSPGPFPTSPDDRKIEFADVPKIERSEKEKDKSKAAEGWARLGRRISLTVGLGKEKEKAKSGKSRSQSRPRKSGEFGQDTLSNGAPQIRLSRPSISPERSSTPQISAQDGKDQVDEDPVKKPRSRPQSLSPTASSNAVPSIPKFQRSKSSKPPKPSRAETEYLRAILADVTAAPVTANSSLGFLQQHHMSSNPETNNVNSSSSSPPSTNAGLFQSAAALSSGSSVQTSSNALASNLWMKLGQLSLPGVEECLKMFTAVEVLDGENMVGCRRCWKIANGWYDEDQRVKRREERRKKRRAVEEGEENDNESDEDGRDGDESADDDDNGDDDDMTGKDSTIEDEGDGHLRQISSAPASPSFHSVHHEDRPPVYTHQNISDRFSLTPQSNNDVALDTDRLVLPPLKLQYSSASTDESGSTSPALLTARPGGPGFAAIKGEYNSADVATWSKDSLLSSEVSSNGLNGRGRPSMRHNDSFTPSTTDYSSDDGESDALSVNTTVSASVSVHSIASSSWTSVSPAGESTTSRSSSSHRDQRVQAPAMQMSRSEPTSGASQTSSQSAPEKPKKSKQPKPTVMRPAYKRYLIATPPPVLVIHLKRFQQVSKVPMMSFSTGFKKLDDYVAFPEFLDLTPFMAPKKEDFGLGSKKGRTKDMKKEKEKKGGKETKERFMYRLYAVVVHIGNMLGGHYIAYTALPNSEDVGMDKGPPAGIDPNSPLPPQTGRQWAYISDTVVRLTTLEEVLKAKAYICMYERI
ncbi:peptidase C19, ubiquitin carboxyl-terminal hydrolase 2 [Dendrothele bispora CBS 962.96]|uniref:ubiquitinyl hydrolase 1 n=1 Tax=Dendrothele bispora (strain CBS 962.96) TaxID=1314807 RepID=A0A4V4HIF9_DENBC|nr:peptidase C19, ubiquitin carboxyl-terminal hydrolase 2 [Dendrothele bispora CBS 962.96]